MDPREEKRVKAPARWRTFSRRMFMVMRENSWRSRMVQGNSERRGFVIGTDWVLF